MEPSMQKPNYCDEEIISKLITPGEISTKYKGFYLNMKNKLNKNKEKMEEEMEIVNREYNTLIKQLQKKKITEIDYNLKESELKRECKKELNSIRSKYKGLNKYYQPIKLTQEEKDFGWREVVYKPGYKKRCEIEYMRWKQRQNEDKK